MTNLSNELNDYSPEELRNMYVSNYAVTFESSEEHAEEMFLSEYEADHDFHTEKNVVDAVKHQARLCGI